MLARSFFARRALTCSFSTTPQVYSGHNKWSKIKERKGLTDTHKSILYGNANRDIIVAARAGGSADPAQNAQLASVVKKYKDQGVPKENLEKALLKANPGKGKSGESITYEAMAFGSVGVVIECLTDNPTRTIHKVRHALTRHGARLTPVKFMFERKGSVTLSIDKSLSDLEKCTEDLIEAALTADADDFNQEPDEDNPDALLLKFTCPPEALGRVAETLASSISHPIRLQSSELVYLPVESVDSSEELDSQVADLVEELEADEDTLRVWTSLDSA